VAGTLIYAQWPSRSLSLSLSLWDGRFSLGRAAKFLVLVAHFSESTDRVALARASNGHVLSSIRRIIKIRGETTRLEYGPREERKRERERERDSRVRFWTTLRERSGNERSSARIAECLVEASLNLCPFPGRRNHPASGVALPAEQRAIMREAAHGSLGYVFAGCVRFAENSG